MICFRSNIIRFAALLAPLWAFKALAAPNAILTPTLTQISMSPDNIIVSEQGFTVGTPNTSWKKVSEARFAPQSSKSTDPGLSIHVDDLNKEQSLEAYTKKWIKEYPYWGFEVLLSKTFTLNGQNGLVVDMLHREKQKQLRQVVFVHKKKAVIMTCTDSQQSFKQSLKECNELIKSFRWQ